jgi:hypothetical protein
MKEKIEQLEWAKNNVRQLLDNAEASIDMHGLAYWAGVVERLREEIKNSL